MALHILQWALLAVSLTLLLSQLAVQHKRAVHLLFAVFCGSIAMMAAKQLSAGSLGPYQYLIGAGAFATCNGYWLVSRALFRREAPVTIVHLLFAASVALLLMSSEGLKFSQALYGPHSPALDSTHVVMGELLNLFSSSMLVLSFWEGCRGFMGSSFGERVQRLLFLGSFGGAVLACVLIGKHSAAARVELYPWLMAVSAIHIMLMTQGLILWRYHWQTLSAWSGSRQEDVESATESPEEVTLSPRALAEVDTPLVLAIKEKLYGEKLFLQSSLKVGDLARHLMVPEYRISRVLRQQFNARNFNHFINALRIDYATRLLESPKHRHWPVLTVGLESGFASAGPFTRAFKAVHGCTPHDYRQTLAGSAALNREVPTRS